MSASVSGGESHPCSSLSISQHLRAAKTKLREASSRGMVTTTMNKVEVDLLEQDVLEVLGYVRSMRNKFVPINRIPGAILSLIPKHLQLRSADTDKDFITLTHVCRGWRELFTSLPSLWTRLDLTNVDKTRTYIKRSNSLPWEITIHDSGDKTYTEGALLMVVPHAKRFKSLTIGRTLDSLRDVARHLTLPVPFLQELTMDFTREPAPSFYFYVGFFNGDLSSLRTLKLAGVHTDLPWRNLRNLTTFKLRCPQNSSITATRLLDFLESTPHLKDITLEHSIPSSKASSRVVHLHNLKNLTIVADPGHAILIQHLFVPKGASLTLEFRFCRDKSPLPILLPVTTGHLENLSPITTVNLRFARTKKFVRLAGPGGAFYILGHWEQEGGAFPPLDLDRRILISLFERFYFHHTQRLTITKCEVPTPNDVKESPLYLILLRMLNLHTLQLILCNNPPFILALNPDCNPSRSVVCPNLEELILYIKARGAFNIPELTSMAKGRGSKDAKLRSMKILGLGEPLPGKEVFQLQEHVTHVEYRFKVGLPKWDNIPEYPTGALEPDQVQSSQAYRFAQGEAKDALTVEQKRRLTEGIKTLNGQELERAKQIILGGVPGLRNITEEVEIQMDWLPPNILVDLYTFVVRPLNAA